MRPPEQIEGFVEARHILVTMDEQRLERRAYVGSTADANPLERGHRVENTPGVHIETRLAQDAREQQEVGDEGALNHETSGPVPAVRVSARPSSISSRSPLTARMSS